MSQETSLWLNRNTLIGFTEKRGTAWHYRASDQGDQPNHYPLAIPVEDVKKRLFYWVPEEAPLEATIKVHGRKVHLIDPTRKAIIHPETHDFLGVFKNGYKVHGFEQWLIDNVSAILDTASGDLHIGSAGLLRKGAVAWVQFELEETQEIAGVEYRPYLTSLTSLDGSLSTTYQVGATLVVCDNTLSASIRNALEAYKVKHSKNSLGRVQAVRDALHIVWKTNDAIADELDWLTGQPVSEKAWQRFLDATAPVDDTVSKRSKTLAETKRDTLEGLWKKDPRVAPWRNTAYGVVAAMNTYDQHYAIKRGMSRPERNMLNMVTGAVDKSDADVLRTLALVTA